MRLRASSAFIAPLGAIAPSVTVPMPEPGGNSGRTLEEAEIEMIRMDEINDAYERMLKADVKYRFVIDNATLAG